MSSHSGKQRFSLSALYFSFTERRRTSDKLIFNIALLAVFGSLLYVVLSANSLFLTSVPTPGGTIVEGIVGTPRFVNPVLAITRADHDMVALVYSGLMKIDENGALVNDIAESITLSEDGRTYAIVLKRGIRFHNGLELTARDVAFTIALIQNPDLKSPLRGNWDGVVVEETGEYELNIVLEEAYAPFNENLTFGILPRELWDELPIEQIPFSQHNTEPIGTGPYKVTDVLRNKSGLITAYELSANSASNYDPNITTIVFNFYQNEEDLLEALRDRQIASTPSISNENLHLVDTNNYEILKSPLPRTFGIYLNQNRSIALRDESARKALGAAIDRQALVDEVLFGYGIPTDSPVPIGFGPVESSSSTITTGKEQAEALLREGGWTKTEAGTWQKNIDDEEVTLAVTLTTANTPLFDATATHIAEAWESIGVSVSVSQFEQADLVQAIIRPRDFETLLYGAEIGRQADLYPFWHSSQKNDPGLNIAQYTNIDVDAYLEQMRLQQDKTLWQEALGKVEAILSNEAPAIFLFVPTFNYVLDTHVTATPLIGLSKPSERFANVSKWHIRSNDLWPIFSNQN